MRQAFWSESAPHRVSPVASSGRSSRGSFFAPLEDDQHVSQCVGELANASHAPQPGRSSVRAHWQASSQPRSFVACNDGTTAQCLPSTRSGVHPESESGARIVLLHGAPRIRRIPHGAHGLLHAHCRPRRWPHESVGCHPRQAGGQCPAQISSPAFDSTTRIFSLNASITNLLAQPIGTTDGTTTDSSAVRAFFSSGPFASGGQPAPSPSPIRGVGVFQGDTVPFFQYTPFIPAGATSAVENWQFLFSRA